LATVGFLILLTAFFVAGEFALVAVDRSRVRRLAAEQNRWAARVERILGRLSFELSGAQLGITITSLLTGALAEPALAGLFRPLLDDLGWLGPRVRPVITIALALLVANLASMLFGELVPKNFAIAKPLGTAIAVAVPMAWLNGLMRPVILFLNRAANWTVRRLGIEPRDDLAGVRSLEELELMIRSSGEEGELDDAELSLLTKAISFTEKVAADIMVPRVSFNALSRHDSVSELRRLARETGHSRFPIYGNDLDDIVGIVHVKDSFKVPAERRSITPLSHIAKPALLVPGSRRLNDLLIDMQRQSRAMAIVVDEYGGTAGIVTIEDLLEEIFGEIADEHDALETPVVSVDGEQRVEVSGQLNRHDLEEQLELEVPEGHFETLGGFLTDQLGRFPILGDVITWSGWTFEVVAMDGRRVDRVAVTPPEGAP
jgi:CBS domain containing-hemolysin-like protein